MKRSYIFLGGLLLVIVLVIIDACTPPPMIKLKQEAHNSMLPEVSLPKAVDVYVDASGSMKGYVDGIQGNFKTNIPNLITNMKNRNSLGLLTDSVRCYTIDNMKLKSHDTDDFKIRISNSSLFNGQSTELNKMFKIVAKETREKKGHVGIIVSDCVLSFPSTEIHSNPDTNINNIGILENSVTDAMTDLVNTGMSVAIVKYESDFNGRYYYTYRNRVLGSANGQVMAKRPYYLIIMGTKEHLDAIFNKQVLPKDYVDIYMYNTDCAKPQYTVIRGIKCGSISDVQDNSPVVKVNNKGDNAYFYLALKDFSVPFCWEKSLPGIMDQPQIKGTLIERCEKVTLRDIQHDYKILPSRLEGKKAPQKIKELLCTYLYKVTLKPNTDLINVSDGVADYIYFPNESMDVTNGSIHNDEVQNIIDLEGKTFMFDHLIDGIEKAYIGVDSNLATVELKILKK